MAGSFHASSATAYVKNFLIDDPRPDKVGHKLKHSCVESDSQGENLYKRQLSLVQGKNDIQLPNWFRYINEDVMVGQTPMNTEALRGEGLPRMIYTSIAPKRVFITF